MKKLMMAVAVGLITVKSALAWCGPCCPPPPCGPGWGCGGGWGSFAGGMIGGMIGGAIVNRTCYSAPTVIAPSTTYVATAPTVVAAPAPVVTQPVYQQPVYTQPVVQPAPVYSAPVVAPAPVYRPPVAVQPVYQPVATPVCNTTTIVQPIQREPLVGVGVNVLGIKVGAGIGL